MSKENISKKINTILNINSSVMAEWYMHLPLLYRAGVTKSVNVDPAIGYKYRFDFAGLLTNEYNIPSEAIIPHMLINGYDSVTDYDGTNLKIYMLDLNLIATIVNTMKR